MSEEPSNIDDSDRLSAEEALRKVWEIIILDNERGISRLTRDHARKILGTKEANIVMTGENVGAIGKIFGSDILKDTPQQQANVARKLVTEMAGNNRGMMRIVRTDMKADRTGDILLRQKKSKSAPDWEKEIKELVDDPESPAAALLAYLYNQVVGKKNVKQFREIFALDARVEPDTVEDAKTLVDMQRLYKEMVEDEGNFDIQKRDGVLDAKIVDSGADVTHHKDQVEKLNQAQADAAEAQRLAAATAMALGKTAPVVSSSIADSAIHVDQAHKAKEKIEALQDKKDELESKRLKLQKNLVLFNNKAQKLNSGIPDTLDLSECVTLSKDFSQIFLEESCTGYDNRIKLGDEEKQISEWLEDSSLSETHEKMKQGLEKEKSLPTMPGKVPARFALRKFLAMYLEPSMYGTPKDEQGPLVANLMDQLLSGSDATAAMEESQQADAEPKKKRRNLWTRLGDKGNLLDLFFGD